MQSYDAYSLKTDVQIGGTDQLFNIITAARKLMEALGEKPNIGVILGILPGTDGVIKMSKSAWQSHPAQHDSRRHVRQGDERADKAMGEYMRLATRWGPSEIAKIEDDLAAGESHPRDTKMMLAREIVRNLLRRRCHSGGGKAFPERVPARRRTRRHGHLSAQR